mgnify:CR=1 FL=1|jgi:hypothetical protein
METPPTTPEGIMLPTIHLNGTGPRTLYVDYSAARLAVIDSIRRLEKMEFNSRDYFMHGMDAWKLAQEQHRARLNQLQSVADELGQIAEHVLTVTKTGDI